MHHSNICLFKILHSISSYKFHFLNSPSRFPNGSLHGQTWMVSDDNNPPRVDFIITMSACWRIKCLYGPVWCVLSVVLCFVASWHHQMETFSVLLAICAANSLVIGEFPAQRPVTRSFNVFLDLHLNKRLSKQWQGWWFEMPLCPLWHHCNG